MAEIATIARPYAEALYKAQAADLAGAAAWLDELAAIVHNAQLLEFAESPKVSDSQLFDLILGVVKTALPQAGQNFLRLVIENRRLAAVPEIALQFRALKNAQSGTADATVFSAFPIDAAALADLSSTLEKRFAANSICVWRLMHRSSVAFVWSWVMRCSTLPSRPVWNK